MSVHNKGKRYRSKKNVSAARAQQATMKKSKTKASAGTRASFAVMFDLYSPIARYDANAITNKDAAKMCPEKRLKSSPHAGSRLIR